MLCAVHTIRMAKQFHIHQNPNSHPSNPFNAESLEIRRHYVLSARQVCQQVICPIIREQLHCEPECGGNCGLQKISYLAKVEVCTSWRLVAMQEPRSSPSPLNTTAWQWGAWEMFTAIRAVSRSEGRGQYLRQPLAIDLTWPNFVLFSTQPTKLRFSPSCFY